MKQFYLLALGIIACGASSFAQSKADEKYRKESAELRKEVWNWEKEQFKVRPIPAQYANKSKVVMAQHTELTADSKSKIAFYGLGFGSRKEQNITEIAREMIKLNDKTAVSYYSELSFTKFERTSGFYSSDKATTYVGVRIIKPNGDVREVDADDVVLTKNASDEKKAKLAVPDLQPGDIIDYFIATQQLVTNDFSNKPYRILLFDDAPIMHLSFHGQLGKKYAVEYRSYNGAPSLSVSKNDEKDIVIDIEKSDLKPFETSLWVAAARQLPFIRLNISLGYKGMGSRYFGAAKPGEISENKDSDAFVKEFSKNMSYQYAEGYWMKAAKAQYDEIEKDGKKKAKQMGLEFKDLGDEDKVALLYYTLRFTKLLNFNINEMQRSIDGGRYTYNGLPFVMFATMKAAGLDPAILVGTDRTGFRMEEIMDSDDLQSYAYLTGTNKFLYLTNIFDIPFTIPPDFEGIKQTKSITFRHPGVITGGGMNLSQITEGFDVGITKPEQNAHIEDLKISLSPDNTNLAIKRKTTLKGNYKIDLQKYLVLYEDFYENERKYFNEEKSLVEWLEDNKKGKKYVDEVKNAFAEARKNQKETFISEAKNWFEQEVTELSNHKVENLGVRHTSPDFVYSSSFKLAGLLKKSGNNYIVEIGKIQGQPLQVKDEQRQRDIDIYMPYGRSIEYAIDLEIPDGYTAEGIAALNKKVENETGAFITTATVEANLVRIKINKRYQNGVERAANWNKILAFTDAANEWLNAKILLKKK